MSVEYQWNIPRIFEFWLVCGQLLTFAKELALEGMEADGLMVKNTNGQRMKL